MQEKTNKRSSHGILKEINERTNERPTNRQIDRSTIRPNDHFKFPLNNISAAVDGVWLWLKMGREKQTKTNNEDFLWP